MIGMVMCKEATRLMSKGVDAPLSLGERFSLRMHLGMCGACRQCNRQFWLLHQTGERYTSAPTPPRDGETGAP